MRVTAEIDLQALAHNINVVRQRAACSQVFAMVKANAYGHGLVLCANNLNADFFGVASLIEARRLREAGITKRIVFMPGIQHQDDLNALKELNLETIIYDERQLELLRKNQSNTKVRVWFKIDTGMHRLGCAYKKAADFLKQLEALPKIEIACVMSHLACADDPGNKHTVAQFESFDKLTRTWSYPRSILNSAGILNFPDFQYEIVRPGLMLYGASPTNHLSVKQIGLKPVMDLYASIFEINEVPKGESVGYMGAWTAQRNSRIAIVSVGYGDGYPQIANNAKVSIRGQACPVVGRVSMDFTAVDVTDLPDVSEGDHALLWGRELPVNEIAEQMDASVYRLLTGIMERVPRKIRY